MKHLLTVLSCTALLVTSCDTDDDTRIMEYTINHHLRPTQAFIPTMGLMAKPLGSTTKDWSSIIGEIEGFEFDWGFQYLIAVLVTPIKKPPQDGASTKLTLLEEISKTPVDAGTTFDITLRTDITNYVVVNSNNEFTILGGILLNCPGACDQLGEALSKEQTVVGTFQHIDIESIKLIGLQITG